MIDVKNLFEVELPLALSTRPQQVAKVNATYQVNVTGEGSWHIDATTFPVKITSGTLPAECTATISSDNFRKLYSNPAKHAMSMVLFGQLKIQGNKAVAMKLKDIFTK